MRRMMQHRAQAADERGATAVMFALMLVPLLVVLAFVGDAGLLYWEKAELQNGADAAALAVAQNCIQSGTSCSSGAAGVAGSVASANANDDNTDASIDAAFSSLQQSHGKVKVTASSPSGNGVPHPFAAVFEPQAASTLHATASTEWGAPVSGTSIALTIAQCEFDDLPPQDPGTTNPVRTLLLINNGSTASPCASGAPGGFGWLDGTNCEATLGVGATVPGEVGVQPNPNKNGCSAGILAQRLCQTVLIPLYASVAGSGSNQVFTISRFAAFVITGVKTSGNNAEYCGGATLSPAFPNGNAKGIQGYFVRYVELGEDFELGSGGPDGGLTIVRFTS